MSYGEQTKESLIEAAGHLFAEHGYDAVSTRAIAEKAGVNLGAIHYHFGGKEALYIEAFRRAISKDGRRLFWEHLEKEPELLQTEEGLAKVILEAVRNIFQDVISPVRPEWQSRLIVKEIATPSSALPLLVEQFFRPDHERLLSLFRRAKPDAPAEVAHIWAFLLAAQGIFYIMAGPAIEQLLGKGVMNKAFLEQLIRVTAKAKILLLDLPLPPELQGD